MQQVLRKDVLTPPKGVRAACRRGLDLRPEHGGDGLTEGAVSRARSMAAGKSVSAETLKRIKAYHDRHTYKKESSPPSPGYVAYLLWGGAAGRSWANSQADSVQKSEGSRGGHVIGHTKTGKPIYASADHNHEVYEHFTAADHADAADAHRNSFAEHNAKARAARGKDSQVVHDSAFMMGHHGFKAQAHDFASRTLAAGHKLWKSAKKGEGSRGGHIIGHTRSGKPVYAANDKNYTEKPRAIMRKYSSDDHADAASFHQRGEAKARSDANALARRHASETGQDLGHDIADSMAGDRKLEYLSHIQAGSQSRWAVRQHMGYADRLAARQVLKKEHHGEGSRGGHIIGHTRSGKPIYSLKHDMNQVKGRAAIQASHQLVGYDQHDHADAASRHLRAYKKLASAKPNKAMAHLKLAADHSVIATGRDLMKPVKTPKAEMSGLHASYDTHAGLAAFHLREADMKRKVAPDEALWHYNQVGLHSSQAMGLRGRAS